MTAGAGQDDARPCAGLGSGVPFSEIAGPVSVVHALRAPSRVSRSSWEVRGQPDAFEDPAAVGWVLEQPVVDPRPGARVARPPLRARVPPRDLH